MSEEYFDVVDQGDHVLGQASRREAHARGLRHRAVHILVFNAQGDLFLQKRSLQKDVAPGLWDSSCSGHVDAGEDYDEAAARELTEELGLRPATAPRRWFRVLAGPETGQEFVWVYRLDCEGPFTLAPSEIDEGRWFAPAELDRLLAAGPGRFAGSFRHIWALAQTQLGTAKWTAGAEP